MRTNVAVKERKPLLVTHGGARATRSTAEQQLRRSVMCCMLWENTFYEDGKDIAQRIQDEALVLIKQGDAEKVADIAYEARTSFKLRHAPLWLTIGLIRAGNNKTLGLIIRDEARAQVADTIIACVQRPDELNELVAMYWKDGKQPLTNQMKKGLAMAFTKFDEYSLGKYANRAGAVKLRDVMFLVHPDPLRDGATGMVHVHAKRTGRLVGRHKDGQGALWQKLADQTLKAPEETWEVQLSAGKDKKKAFTDLLTSGSLGALALLRNLRNMIEAGVDTDLICSRIATMKTERVLPFRFITAAKYAPWLEPSLEEAMFRCLEGMPKLKGKTILIVDCSGSMYGMISAKSEMDRLAAAAALAMLLREQCEDVRIYATAGSDSTRTHKTMIIPARRGFALRDLLKYDATSRTIGGGGIFLTQVVNYVRAQENETADRIIVFTDEQDYDTRNPPAKAAPFGRHNYLINVAVDKNGISYNKQWTHLDGFSEAVVDFIAMNEQN